MFGFGKKSAASKACAAYISQVAEQYDRAQNDLLEPMIVGFMDAGASQEKVQEILNRGTHQYAFLIGIFFWHMAQMIKHFDESTSEIISEQFSKAVFSSFGDEVGKTIMNGIGICIQDAQAKSMFSLVEEEEDIRKFAVNRILFLIVENDGEALKEVVHSEKVISAISHQLNNFGGDWWGSAKRSNAFGL